MESYQVWAFDAVVGLQFLEYCIFLSLWNSACPDVHVDHILDHKTRATVQSLCYKLGKDQKEYFGI